MTTTSRETGSATEGWRTLATEPALDGIRGIAVILVLFFHSTGIIDEPPPWVHGAFLGVDMFFVLSGFLITSLLLNEHHRYDRIDFRAFYERRVLRLLPALGFFLLGAVGWAIVIGESASLIATSILSTAFFFNNLHLNWFDEPTIEATRHLWSLSVEEQFYFVWPFAMGLGLAARRRNGAVVAVIIALIALIAAYRFNAFEADLRRIISLYTHLWSRGDSLLVGAVLAQLWIRGLIPRTGPPIVGLAGIATIGWIVANDAVSSPELYRGRYTLFAVATAAVIWSTLGPKTWLSAPLRLAPLRVVGRVSYAVYLWHVVVLAAVVRWAGDWPEAARVIVALGGTAAIVAISWRWIEQPALRLKNRRSAERRRLSAESDGAAPA